MMHMYEADFTKSSANLQPFIARSFKLSPCIPSGNLSLLRLLNTAECF